jgi:hypothetical protein
LREWPSAPCSGIFARRSEHDIDSKAVEVVEAVVAVAEEAVVVAAVGVAEGLRS